MQNQFSRTELIYGEKAMDKLKRSRVAVFGIGGVGGYAVEALARSGIGAIDLIDDDKFCISNINRQIYATLKTIGEYKVDVAAKHLYEINPDIIVRTHKVFYTAETSSNFDFRQYDYVIDAIDTVAGKLALVENAEFTETPIISSMGAGNKVDPTAFQVSDIYKTSVCPLAKVMRTELRKRGIKRLKVVYSKELPTILFDNFYDVEDDHRIECTSDTDTLSSRTNRRQIPGSNAFVPSVAGLIIAGEVVKDLTGNKGRGIGG